MKPIVKLLVAVPTFLVSPSQAALQSMPAPSRQLIIQDGRSRYESVRPSYTFRIELVSDDEGVKPEAVKNGRPFVTARKDERYAVRLYNPLPVRVAVNLTIDGLNSLTGKPSGIRDGQKWIIDSYGFITIRGWQVNSQEARRFFFTDTPKAYAQWRGDWLGKDLAANCGVIGAAYFWSQKELDAFYDAHPVYVHRQPQPFAQKMGSANGVLPPARSMPLSSLQDMPAPSAAKERAGTGMGERETFATTQVEFDYDCGMKRASQAVVIYYDFAERPMRDPFPALTYAPEIP